MRNQMGRKECRLSTFKQIYDAITINGEDKLIYPIDKDDSTVGT